MTLSTAPLETHALVAGYGAGSASRAVVGPIDVSLSRGSLACLLGPNGAGKSTLIRTVTGTQPPLSGQVRVAGRPLHTLSPRDRARHVGVVLTDRVQAPMMTVRGLVELGRYPHTGWQGRLSVDDQHCVNHALDVTGAGRLADRLVNELSDGERQRALVARALAQEPDLLVLDEVTAFLDLPARIDLLRLLRRIAREEGRAIVLSTHDLDLALRSADVLWLLAGDGTLVTGLPEALVVSGAFSQAFAGRGLVFDAEQGAFLTHTPGDRVALVRGGGTRAVWTRRALERWGYAVVNEPTTRTTLTVDVTSSDEWLVAGSHGSVTCADWTTLESAVRRS